MAKFLAQIVHRCWVVVAIATLTFCWGEQPVQATGVYQMPPMVDSDTWVIDDANHITRINEGQFKSQLQALAQKTGNAVRFVTIHRLDYGETAQSFAEQLFTQWFPTPEAQANQTVVVLDDVTNTVGIQVGTDSATLLTPDIAESVSQKTMQAPLLKGRNQYNQSFEDALARLSTVLAGQADPGAPEIAFEVQVESTFASAQETEENRSNSTLIVIILLILATVIPMATYYWYQSMGG